MSTIDIRLPESLKSFLDEQVASRGYRDASAYVESLLEAERHRQVGRDVEHALLEAAEGPFTDWTDDDVADIRRIGQRLIEKRQRS